jgi:predicted acetyltransferase
MELDLSKSEIQTPSGEALIGLYQMLMEAFPVDRPVFSEMIATGKPFYTWTPYALYLDDELLGNVSLMPVRIWLGGQTIEVVGVASVATREAYRKRGIAKHIMQHCLAIVDQQRLPAVLFTGLPNVYKGLGFQAIHQTYLAAASSRLPRRPENHNFEVIEHLDDGQIDILARIYADEYPNYDGKVVRDSRYWQLYKLLLHNYPSPRIVLCRWNGQAVGYARLEPETDRLLVSELCSNGSATAVAEALMAFAARYASQLGLDLVSLALPPDHFAKEILRRHGVLVEAEPPGSHRETFMVRPPPGHGLGELAQLQWSLADKF